MLFDLRGRGRRRFIKVVYIALAFLMGLGFVGFGIGGDVTGGIFDAITERGPGTDDTRERAETREREALAKLRVNPKDEAAYGELIRARIQLSRADDRFDPNTNTYTEGGKAQLNRAKEA